MSQQFLREARHVAHLAYDFGKRWLEFHRWQGTPAARLNYPPPREFPFRSEIEGLYSALEAVPQVSTPRYSTVLDRLRVVRDLVLRLQDCTLGIAPMLGPELCSAGQELDEAVEGTTPESPQPLSWMDQVHVGAPAGHDDDEVGRQHQTSLDSLIAVIESLLAFARNHAGFDILNPSTLLTPEQLEELHALDAELSAQCTVNGLRFPAFLVSQCGIESGSFGNTKLPYYEGTIHHGARAWHGMQLLPTDDWQHALRTLKTTAQALNHQRKSSGIVGDGVATEKVAAPALSERQYNILEALWLLGATGPESRKTTEQVAIKAEGKGCNPASLKDSVADLKQRQLIDTKPSRGGGCWLSASGKALILQVIEERKNQ